MNVSIYFSCFVCYYFCSIRNRAWNVCCNTLSLAQLLFTASFFFFTFSLVYLKPLLLNLASTSVSVFHSCYYFTNICPRRLFKTCTIRSSFYPVYFFHFYSLVPPPPPPACVHLGNSTSASSTLPSSLYQSSFTVTFLFHS